MDKVRRLMKGNGYPDFVSNKIKNRVNRFYNGKNLKETEKKRFIPTPYVAGLSERLKKSLYKYDLTVSCKSKNSVGNIYSRMKYTVPKQNKSKAICSVECEQCNVKRGHDETEIKRQNVKT